MAKRRDMDTEALHAALTAAMDRLLAERTDAGHWVGELSDSALSTATAVFALARDGAESNAPFVRRGLDWLAEHQNDDGGWGDTVRSGSNLSTALLAYAALASTETPDERHAGAVRAAERYLTARAGSVEPGALARAVTARYGRDRTFSAPILAFCALAGRLGPPRDAWKHVAALPFELAACPHGALRALRLPVVSYALPALIAIGQLRHHRRPTRNPLARCLRNMLAGATLRRLAQTQPDSGGFLEAAPLTSFVLMSLRSIPAGRSPGPAHRVADRAAAFLRDGARPGGAWPIDTDLATWVTTLAVNALAGAPSTADALSPIERRAIGDWLLDQQHLVEHPYTAAAPGGWAWTDRSGGVPDADDTAGALRALRHLGPADDRTRDAAAAGCTWLADLQNADGGIPTFCRGWGRLPFDRSCADLTAHAIAAWSAWQELLPARPARRAERAVKRATAFLGRTQAPSGAWTPLWFGNELAPGQANCVYGTARVLLATASCGAWTSRSPLRRGVRYLLAAQGPDGGWGGDAGVPAGVEETSLAVSALCACAAAGADDAGDLPAETVRSAVAGGARWIVERTRGGQEFPPTPIGLYFASLWYFERLYPVIFAVGALSRAAELLDA